MEYVNADDWVQAIASLSVDLTKHDETRVRAEIIGEVSVIIARASDPVDAARSWINGLCDALIVRGRELH